MLLERWEGMDRDVTRRGRALDALVDWLAVGLPTPEEAREETGGGHGAAILRRLRARPVSQEEPMDVTYGRDRQGVWRVRLFGGGFLDVAFAGPHAERAARARAQAHAAGGLVVRTRYHDAPEATEPLWVGPRPDDVYDHFEEGGGFEPDSEPPPEVIIRLVGSLRLNEQAEPELGYELGDGGYDAFAEWTLEGDVKIAVIVGEGRAEWRVEVGGVRHDGPITKDSATYIQSIIGAVNA